MTPQERQILEEAEQQAFDTSVAFNEPRTKGIRPEPVIDESETTLDGQPFGLDFSVDPVANVLPGASIPTPETSVCPTTETITITFTGIVTCPGDFVGDFNGAYVLTGGPPIWTGAGADYDTDPSTGPFHTIITVQCGGPSEFSIDYRDENGSPSMFLSGIITIPPSSCADNVLTCDDGIASGGTGCVT